MRTSGADINKTFYGLPLNVKFPEYTMQSLRISDVESNDLKDFFL